MATSFIPGTFKAVRVSCVPMPPAPISAMFILSLALTRLCFSCSTYRLLFSVAKTFAPVVKAAVVVANDRKNFLRDEPAVIFIWLK